MGDHIMQTRASLLSEVLAEWNAHSWPLSDLDAFRMEGEGDGAAEGGTEGQGGGTEGGGDGGGDQTDWKAEAEKWKTQARKHEDRAKANAAATKELEQLRQQHMTEQEKAIEAAKAEARAEALTGMSGRLVHAEIRAAAAGRMADEQLATLIEGINASAFITDTGDVDQDKVSKFVDGLAPKAEESGGRNGGGLLDLGQGARNGSDQALNGDPLLRDIKAKLGVR